MAIKSKPQSAAAKKREADAQAGKGAGLVSVDKTKYTSSKSASGKASLHNGDAVASTLAGMELKNVYRAASRMMDVTAKSLEEKYGHLNQGMQRMNLGNRIRAVYNKTVADESQKAADKALKAAVA